MTSNLPATHVEAEALALARDRITRLRENGSWLLGVEGSALDPATDHLMARRWCKFTAQLNPQNASLVVDLAIRNGERSAHEALVELIDEKTDRNEPLGAVLGAYSIRLRKFPFRAHRGPSRTTLIEDLALAIVILETVERFCLHPTRNQKGRKRHPSGCSIVMQAAAAAGLHRGGEEAFQQIWKRYAPVILPGYRWPNWGKGRETL
jgi:hypothetical protein